MKVWQFVWWTLSSGSTAGRRGGRLDRLSTLHICTGRPFAYEVFKPGHKRSKGLAFNPSCCTGSCARQCRRLCCYPALLHRHLAVQDFVCLVAVLRRLSLLPSPPVLLLPPPLLAADVSPFRNFLLRKVFRNIIISQYYIYGYTSTILNHNSYCLFKKEEANRRRILLCAGRCLLAHLRALRLALRGSGPAPARVRRPAAHARGHVLRLRLRHLPRRGGDPSRHGGSHRLRC